MFQNILSANVTRVLVAGLLLSIQACTSSTGSSSSGDANAPALTLPPGIASFKSATAAIDAGIYPGNERACCFLAPSARLLLNKPTGKLRAILNFYVPKMEPGAANQTVTVTAAGKSVFGSLKGGPARRILITLDLPPSAGAQSIVPVTITASKSFIPSEIGLNSDRRKLSVVLTKVEYP